MGVQAIKKMGGKVIAQDQANSESFRMPESAINNGSVDWVVPLDEIAATLMNLLTQDKTGREAGLSPHFYKDGKSS